MRRHLTTVTLGVIVAGSTGCCNGTTSGDSLWLNGCDIGLRPISGQYDPADNRSWFGVDYGEESGDVLLIMTGEFENSGVLGGVVMDQSGGSWTKTFEVRDNDTGSEEYQITLAGFETGPVKARFPDGTQFELDTDDDGTNAPSIPEAYWHPYSANRNLLEVKYRGHTIEFRLKLK